MASLSVTFFPPFAGGYHVFALDKRNYAWALISGPSRDYLWLLARRPDLDAGTRDRLIADDGALTDWMQAAPETDVQPLRALIRQARKDAQGVTERPGEALRHGKAYREIFQLVRAALNRDDADEPSSADDHHE